MAASNKAVKIAGTPVYDTELIYTIVLMLQQSRNFNMQTILTYELSATVPALFDVNGDMRLHTKANLRNQLKVELSNRRTSPPDAIIIDGCAYLWSVHWPTSGTIFFIDTPSHSQRIYSMQPFLQKCSSQTCISIEHTPAATENSPQCDPQQETVDHIDHRISGPSCDKQFP